MTTPSQRLGKKGRKLSFSQRLLTGTLCIRIEHGIPALVFKYRYAHKVTLKHTSKSQVSGPSTAACENVKSTYFYGILTIIIKYLLRLSVIDILIHMLTESYHFG